MDIKRRAQGYKEMGSGIKRRIQGNKKKDSGIEKESVQ